MTQAHWHSVPREAPARLPWRRIVSALILMSIALTVALAGGIMLAGFTALAGVLLAVEWTRMAHGRDVIAMDFSLLCLGAMGVAGFAGAGAPMGALLIALGTAIVSGSAAWLAGRRGIVMGLGALYILIPAAAFIVLRQGPDGLAWVLWLFSVVWASDTGAYLGGRLIGGPSLDNRFLVNKTWAGLALGLGCGIASGLGAEAVFFTHSAYTAWPYLVPVSAAALLGDLAESAVKRRAGVKDSGALIPGHGGALDRLDGFLFAVMMLMALRIFGF